MPSGYKIAYSNTTINFMILHTGYEPIQEEVPTVALDTLTRRIRQQIGPIVSSGKINDAVMTRTEFGTLKTWEKNQYTCVFTDSANSSYNVKLLEVKGLIDEAGMYLVYFGMEVV